MGFLNTSYDSNNQTKVIYRLVAKTDRYAILRVLDPSLYHTYWREFISASVSDEPSPESQPMFLRIESAPSDTILVDQYADFTPEIPIVTLEYGNASINVSDRITANRPNTEVPGLYRVDYRLNLTHDFSTPIWNCYLSVQNRPLLRTAAAGWTRDSYILKTLNRLVMEPQFLEALHAAGEPLYGFMEANQHPSLLASRLTSYAGPAAYGIKGKDSTYAVFITGLKLPQGSVLVYNQRMLQLQEPVWPDPIGSNTHMDPSTHKPASSFYQPGAVVRSGNNSYICIQAADPSTPTGNSNYWRQGYLYKFKTLNDDSFSLPAGILSTGKGFLEHIWATVDDQGYSFWVDILNQSSLGPYRGYYDRKYYADYATDDLVSYISEDSIRLFKRKATDIQDPGTLIYPPGHHLNPAWEEVYARFEDDHAPLLGTYTIVPHTNASNAILSRTWSVSAEACGAFAHMVGIPDTILKECGAKWSALLFALLSRTRNTFEGLRLCFRAVGMDVKNLHLADPSIAYYCRPDSDSPISRVDDIYAQHDILRSLLSHIHTLKPAGHEDPMPADGSLRYVTESMADHGEASYNDIGVAIQQYDEDSDAWITRYRFEHFQDLSRPIQNANNRYYEADLDVLARLAEDAVADLGDDIAWVKESAWAGSPSALISACLKYEIPIYIWLVLKMHLYAETNIRMQGYTYSGICDGQRGGIKNSIELFPSVYFSKSAHGFATVETGVFRYEDNEWRLLSPSRITDRGSRIYEFDSAQYRLKIGAVHPENYAFVRFWQSTHTFGLLGLSDSPSTVNDVPYINNGHFRNVTDPAVTDQSELMLINGHVGVTAIYRPIELNATAESLNWMYVLDGSWILDDTPFVDYADMPSTAIYTYEGSVASLFANLASVTNSPIGGSSIAFSVDNNALLLYGAIPNAIYLKDANDAILAAYTLSPGMHVITADDYADYPALANMASARITFAP